MKVRARLFTSSIWLLLFGLLSIVHVPPDTPDTPADPQATSFYVAPTGSPSGDGSIGRPWDLQTALNGPGTVRPGDTIWVRGGNYTSVTYNSHLNGTATAPIIVRNYNGERASIVKNGYNCASSAYNPLKVYGSYTWFWGLEIRNDDPNRIDTTGGCRGVGVNIDQSGSSTSVGTRLINMVLHDNDQGVGFWTEAPDSVVYGSLIYNNGIVDPNERGGRGHGIYVQNDTGTKKLYDNIIYQQFDYGIHAYAQDGQLHNLDVQGNTVFDNGLPDNTDSGHGSPGILVGGTTYQATGINVSNNYLYMIPPMGSTNLQMGYSTGVVDRDITIANNIVQGGYPDRWLGFNTMSVSGNLLVAAAGSGPVMDLDPRGNSTSSYSWNNNQYFGGSSSPFLLSGSSRTFAQWKTATGMDSASSYSSGRPTGARVFVRPNLYEGGRANITVYNFDRATTVAADVSAVLSPGDSYEVRNGADFYAPAVLSGVYAGGALSVPMTGLGVATPTGWAAQTSPYPDFGVFVLLRTVPGGTPLPTSTATRTVTPTSTRTLMPTRTPTPTLTNTATTTPTGMPTSTATVAPTATPCPNLTEWERLRVAFGSAEGQPYYDAGSDYNSDGVVNVVDVALFRQRFGTCH
jgi:hypothetical protein